MPQVKVTIGPSLRAYLEDLLESGLYGSSLAGVCRRLIEREVERLIVGGLIVAPPVAEQGDKDSPGGAS